MIFTVEKRDVRCPELFRLGTFFLDPLRNLREDVAALFPLVRVLGAADRDLPFAFGAVTGAEQVPGRSFSNDGRVVDEFNIAARFQCLRRSRCLLRQRNWE
jgi:hypothetical protein